MDNWRFSGVSCLVMIVLQGIGADTSIPCGITKAASPKLSGLRLGEKKSIASIIIDGHTPTEIRYY